MQVVAVARGAVTKVLVTFLEDSSSTTVGGKQVKEKSKVHKKTYTVLWNGEYGVVRNAVGGPVGDEQECASGRQARTVLPAVQERGDFGRPSRLRAALDGVSLLRGKLPAKATTEILRAACLRMGFDDASLCHVASGLVLRRLIRGPSGDLAVFDVVLRRDKWGEKSSTYEGKLTGELTLSLRGCELQKLDLKRVYVDAGRITGRSLLHRTVRLDPNDHK